MATERKISYYLTVNPEARSDADRFILNVRDDRSWSRPLYSGTSEKCSSLALAATFGDISKDDFVAVDIACVSHLFDKKGNSLVAMITPDRKVYLGLRDDYDNHGNYFNKDYPMIFVSENDDVFDLIAGGDGSYSVREMKAKNAFGPGELEAFVGLGLFVRM